MLERREFLRLCGLSGAALLVGCNQSVAPTAQPSPTASASGTSAIGQGGAEFIVRNRRPKDLETPVEAFQEFLTPNERFFVRSHHPEPTIADKDWELTITVPEKETFSLNLEALKSFEATTVTAVLQCAGNSRGMHKPRVPGVQWGRGAVGNAAWKGARLKDILEKAGAGSTSPAHVVIHGSDKPLMDTVPIFEREIPLAKCLHPDTLLAYEMNGEPLPRLHGGPVRLVVPGWVGDDWIKWVSSITLQDTPCQSFYFKKGYRYPTVSVEPGGSVPADKMEPMEELVTRSLFSFPSQGETLTVAKAVTLKGVAWTGGDATITKVEVSDDEGETWTEVDFKSEAHPYAWRLWEVQWTPKRSGPVVLRCRATDSRKFVQPLEDSPWNPGGYLWKTADRLEVEVKA